jgi:glucose uptake protein GlcU
MNPLLAYGCALGAVLGFGSNFVPVKRYEASDGMFFQLVMCIGVWCVGCVVHGLTGYPEFQPWAMLGGCVWCMGNVMCVPVIKMIGLGQGMLIWGTTNMLVGWATGTFQLFGIKPHADVEVDRAMNYGGVFLAVVALSLYALLEPTIKTPEELRKERGRSDSQQGLEDGLLAGHGMPTPNFASIMTGTPHAMSADPYIKRSESNQALQTMHDEMIRRQVQSNAGDMSKEPEQDLVALREVCATGSTPSGSQDAAAAFGVAAIDALSPASKKVLGVSLALLAGCFFGSNFDPPLKLISDGKDPAMLHYVYPHFCGILLTSIFFFIIYCAARRNEPVINRELFLPAFFSGVIWGLAQTCWFVVQGALPQEVAFPIVTSGPGLVASVWGMFVFNEISGRRNIMILVAAFVITAASDCLIVLSTKEVHHHHR